jgi:hypothetical protein
MAILDQFKSLNLILFFLRKLCFDEVRRVKMKKNEKRGVLQFEKNVFSLLLGWFCISKMIYKA